MMSLGSNIHLYNSGGVKIAHNLPDASQTLPISLLSLAPEDIDDLYLADRYRALRRAWAGVNAQVIQDVQNGDDSVKLLAVDRLNGSLAGSLLDPNQYGAHDILHIATPIPESGPEYITTSIVASRSESFRGIQIYRNGKILMCVHDSAPSRVDTDNTSLDKLSSSMLSVLGRYRSGLEIPFKVAPYDLKPINIPTVLGLEAVVEHA